MTNVTELEAEVAATRERLNLTIGRIQDKLTVSGMVDEVMGQAGVPRLDNGHDFVFGLLRRHPVPVMIAAAGLGLWIYQMNRKARAPVRLSGRGFDDDDAPLVATTPARVYDPDLAHRHPPSDIVDTRRVEA